MMGGCGAEKQKESNPLGIIASGRRQRPLKNNREIGIRLLFELLTFEHREKQRNKHYPFFSIFIISFIRAF